MGKKNDPYETKTVRRHKDAERLVNQGWEIVATSGRQSWFWGSNLKITLRRPNPRCR